MANLGLEMLIGYQGDTRWKTLLSGLLPARMVPL